MKWYKYVLVMILCLVPNIIHAECSNSEIVGYQEQAKNINVTYDYTEHPENNYVSFSIKINNLNKIFLNKYFYLINLFIN